MRCITTVLAVFLLLGVCPWQSLATDFPRDEYQQHCDQYLLSLADLSVDVVETRTSPDKETITQLNHSIISIPNYFRVKSETITTKSGSKSAPKEVGELLRPDGYFFLYKTLSGNFLLRERDRSTRSLADVQRGSGLSVVLYPLCRGGYSIAQLLAGKVEGHKLVSSDFQKGGAGDSVKYTFKTTDTINGEKAETSYELNSHWLVTRCTIEVGQGRKRVQEITYITFDGRLLPLKYSSQILGEPPGPSAQIEFQNYNRFDGSPEDFSFQQFGLREINEDQSTWRRRAPLYFLMGAAFLFFLLIIVRRWYQGRSPKRPPG